MKKSRVRGFWFGLFFWVAVTGMTLHAADIVLRPVPPDGGPTQVYVAMGLLDIDEIDSAEQNFTANLYIATRWNDPRLVHKESGKKVFGLDEVWHPRLLYVNQQKIWPTLPEIVYVDLLESGHENWIFGVALGRGF